MTNPEQLAFLAAAMEASDRPTIVVFHHPALSCAAFFDAEAVLDHWVPLFDDDVVLVLSGHDHNYQRFSADGVTYVVTGGGGWSLFGLAECSEEHPPRLVGAAVHHFLAVAQTNAGLTVVAIDVDRLVIDQFTVPLDWARWTIRSGFLTGLRRIEPQLSKAALTVTPRDSAAKAVLDGGDKAV